MARAVSRCGSGRLPVAAWRRLYEERVRRGLTQTQVAYIIKTNQQTLSNWEQKRFRPARRFHAALALFLNLDKAAFRTEILTEFPYLTGEID